MTVEQFAYWMQGFSELTGDEMPSPAQWKMMKEHLATVFLKVTPPLSADPIEPSKIQPMRPVLNPPYFPQDWHPGLTPATPLRPLRSECLSGVVATYKGPTTTIC